MSNSAMPAPTRRRVSTPVLGSVAEEEVVPDVEVELIGGGVVSDESGGLELRPEPLLELPDSPKPLRRMRASRSHSSARLPSCR